MLFHAALNRLMIAVKSLVTKLNHILVLGQPRLGPRWRGGKALCSIHCRGGFVDHFQHSKLRFFSSTHSMDPEIQIIYLLHTYSYHVKYLKEGPKVATLMFYFI